MTARSTVSGFPFPPIALPADAADGERSALGPKVHNTVPLHAACSGDYAGRPIGIGTALVIRAVGHQFIGAISTTAAGWWLQTTTLADYSNFFRVCLSIGFCISIYLIIVVGLFRLTDPINVAAKVVRDQLQRNR